MLIAFTGHARVGKDFAAGALRPMGFDRVAFADGVRQALYAIDPLVEKRIEHNGGVVRLATLVDQVGWDQAKQYHEVRELLQRVGTEAGRDVHGEDCWVRRAEREIDRRLAAGTPVVVTDVRFANEADMVRRKGGVVVRVVRPGYGPVNGHVSDAGQAGLLVDYELHNDAGPSAWREKVQQFAENLSQIAA